jgi:aldehyde dehydrogenase (NAD+)
VLKPAEDTSLSALRFAEIATAAGLPEGALNIVTGLGEEAGAALAAHPGIDFISFTGSNEVGTLVQQAAARNAVKCVLELGGKSPQIVFEDVDADRAVPIIVRAIVQNAGQTCTAGSRLLVQRSIQDSFVARVAEAFAKVRVGTPAMDLDCGPVMNPAQQRRVQRYIDQVFGPVLAVLPFEDEADAIALANGTDYGLLAAVWTENAGRLQRVAKAVKAGQVFMNCYGAGGGVELPFGGTKRSGHGREKGLLALEEMSTTKTLVHWHG